MALPVCCIALILFYCMLSIHLHPLIPLRSVVLIIIRSIHMQTVSIDAMLEDYYQFVDPSGRGKHLTWFWVGMRRPRSTSTPFYQFLKIHTRSYTIFKKMHTRPCTEFSRLHSRFAQKFLNIFQLVNRYFYHWYELTNNQGLL